MSKETSELRYLLKQIRMRRYREGSPERILADIFEELSRTQYGRAGWDLIVELLADKLRAEEMSKYRFSLLPETEHKDLADRFSDELEHYIVAAREKPWDYLGEVFIKNQLDNKSLGQHLTPKSVVDLMLQMTIGEKVEETKTILDPTVGTGRFLIEATLLYPEAPLLLYGVEIDVSLYRACIVNLSMFSKHPFAIICADFLRLDPNMSGPNSPLWVLAGNRWNPPRDLIEKFYWKPPPISVDKFSLSHLIKIKRRFKNGKYDKALQG